jgi:sugar O-acyltransferase (sialic acid O-acetyltransferase NeuD family)
VSKIILAGSGVTAKILSQHLNSDKRYEIAGSTVDDEFLRDGGIAGPRVVGISEVASVFPPTTHRVVMAMGYNNLNRSRGEMFARLKLMGYVLETYINPDARVYTETPLGEGSVVLPGAVIEPYAEVGVNTMVWSNVTLAHHSNVGDHCWVATGAVVSGKARVEHNSFLGVNCTVVNEVCVGEFNIVGAGGLISRDTKPYSVHLARSAETIRYSSEEYSEHFRL